MRAFALYDSRISDAVAGDPDCLDAIVDMESLVMITCCIDSVYNQLLISIFNSATQSVFLRFQHTINLCRTARGQSFPLSVLDANIIDFEYWRRMISIYKFRLVVRAYQKPCEKSARTTMSSQYERTNVLVWCCFVRTIAICIMIC